MLGIADADSAEHNSGSKNVVITAISCALPGSVNMKYDGHDEVTVRQGSRAAQVFAEPRIRERYFCNYEMNRDYVPRFEAAGLKVAGYGPQGEPRMVEIEQHPFFLAMLFQPQLSSTPRRPHRMVMAFVQAVAAGEQRAEATA